MSVVSGQLNGTCVQDTRAHPALVLAYPDMTTDFIVTTCTEGSLLWLVTLCMRSIAIEGEFKTNPPLQ